MGSDVHENLLRRMAERQGYQFSKSRRRDPKAIDYGTYTLTPTRGKAKVFKNLADVEEFLTR